MKAVVLAAGIGKRLRPLTYRRPKPMVYLLNKPILQHVLEGIKEAGFDEILLVTGYKEEVIKGYFKNGEDFGIKIQYITQEKRDGTASAALLARDFVGDSSFLLAFGDIVVPKGTYKKVWELLSKTGATGVMTVNPVEDVSQGAAVVLDRDGWVKDIVEKPTTPISNLNNSGIFAFKPEIFEFLKRVSLSPRGEYELTDALRELAERRLLFAHRLEGYWSDVGRPSSLLELTMFFLKGGNLVDPSAEVSPEAELVNCCVASGCKIGNCVLENVIIFPEAVVEDGAVLKNVILDEGAFIKANTRIFSDMLNPSVVE